MNSLLNRLYGFDELGFGTEGAVFGFAVPTHGWMWAAILSIALGLGLAVYARAPMRIAAKWAACGCRVVLLMLLGLLAFGPRLEKPRTRVSPDRVLYLVDRSASMAIADGAGVSRDQQLRALLADNADTFASIDEAKDTIWYAFGDEVSTIQAGENAVPRLASPADRATRIGDALNGALDQNTGHPLSAIVLISDGRATDPLGRATRIALGEAGVPVIAVPLGSADREPDLAISGASAPSLAFVNDTLPVTIALESTGPGGPAPVGGRAEIVDAATGEILGSSPLGVGDIERGELTIPVSQDRAGEARWIARVVPDGPDLSLSNNETPVSVRFVEDPIRVLYIDGAPRWEQRYLKTLLIREESVDVSCLLLASDRRFQQEGNTVLDALPADDDGWDEFDLIIVGDIRPELLGDRASRAVLAQVGDRSTGLLWLAGPSANPHAWGGTPAGSLLPVRLGASSAPLPLWSEPVVFSPTPISDRLGLFRELTEQTRVSDFNAGWSRLRWALRISPDLVKPSAEPLAYAAPVGTAPPGPDSETPSPLVLGMRYGSGRTALVATDEIWRWRYGQGESATERFWLPLIRHLARPRLAGLGAGARLETSARLVPIGQQIVVELIVTDRVTAEVLPASIEAAASPEPPSRESQTPFTLTRDDAGDGPTRYRGAFTPVRPGRLQIGLADESLLPAGLIQRVEVISPNDELRALQTDHEVLASLASDTGGTVLSPDSFDRLPSLLPNRRVITPLAPETRTLWDHPAPLAILLLLSSVEWIIRRRSRLP